MDKVSLTFLVFFEDPFWIGIVERISDGTMEVCRITFGAEPKDYEVYEWLLKNYDGLRLSPPSCGCMFPFRFMRLLPAFHKAWSAASQHGVWLPSRYLMPL